MRKTIPLILACLLISLCRLSGQSNAEIAASKLKLAVELMDEGVYDESLALLDEAEALDPDTYVYSYEKAYAHYLQKDYGAAVKLLKKSAKHDDATDLVYQMLGNIHDYSGDPQKALKTYSRGLKKFPGSGRLYLESGVVHLNMGDYGSAMKQYEAGIAADPHFPSNYFHAAYLYLNSDNKAQGMVYGETFVNIESSGERASTMSAMLYDAYRDNISFPDDTTTVISFSNKTISFGNGPITDFRIPFPIAYELTLSTAVAAERSVDMASLAGIRSRFLDLWLSDEMQWHLTYPYPVFDYQRRIAEAGHFEAYTYWLLSGGDQTAFDEWHADNEEKFDAFAEWFNENDIIFE